MKKEVIQNLEIVKQAKNFTDKLSKVQKIIIGSVVGVVLLGIFILLFTAGSSEDSSKKILFSDLESSDAAKITEILKENQIEYDFDDNGSTILVDQNVLYDTRLKVAAEGLPETSVVGYEIFDRTNLGMSEFVQKLNYRRALEGELSRTINAMTEVKKSRVHIVIPENALFEKDQKEPTASVTLHLNSGRGLNKISVEGIQNLIASSVEGMNPTNVTVTDARGKILSPPPIDETSLAGKTAVQHEQQRKVEEYLTNKVQSLLDGVLGVGNSEVRVNADLDFSKQEITKTDFDPEEQVVRSEQTVATRGDAIDSLGAKPIFKSGTESSNVIANYEISQTVEKFTKGIGTIKRLTVSALINGSYRNLNNIPVYKERDSSTINELEQIIKNAVGYDNSRQDEISIYQLRFDTMDELREFEYIPWWKQPQNIKLMILISAMLLTILLIYKLLRMKQIKDRVRIALELPEKVDVPEEDLLEEEEEEEEEDYLEGLELDEDELLLLPAELPEQLLLEGDSLESDDDDEYGDESSTDMLDKDALAEKARAKLEESEQTMELTEEQLMKIELKQKIEDFILEQPDEATRLVRAFMSQDFSKGIF